MVVVVRQFEQTTGSTKLELYDYSQIRFRDKNYIQDKIYDYTQ